MKSAPHESESPSELIDARIEELGDWRGEMLARLRARQEADPEVIEEWKWRGTPVWSHDGMICTGETYKNVVKMTFAKGASLKDPSGLFNSSLEGNIRRAIDFHEGDKVDEKALKALIRAAVALNTSSRDYAGGGLFGGDVEDQPDVAADELELAAHHVGFAHRAREHERTLERREYMVGEDVGIDSDLRRMHLGRAASFSARRSRHARTAPTMTSFVPSSKSCFSKTYDT